MRVVFMGTPDFAVPCLAALIDSPHTVAAVFSQPDKPVGRKQLLTAPPVKQYALTHNIPVYQPESLKRDSFALDTLKDICPDIIIVVAYGKLLPKSILQLPRYGCVNIHASLLPSYRGAAPIQWSIVKGEQVTGVTSMLLDEGMDTGDILLSSSVKIENEDNAITLSEKLSSMGASLLLQTISALQDNSVTPQPQDNDRSSLAPILQKSDGLINWSESASSISCLIRGLVAWPTAYTTVQDKRLKIYKAQVCGGVDKPCGSIVCSRDEIVIACGGDSALKLLDVQLEGSRRMSAAELLHGRRLENIERLGE